MKGLLFMAFLCSQLPVGAEGVWHPQGDRIKTQWGERVMPDRVWQSYPRPQLKRDAWMNLNGLWDYAVTTRQVTKQQVSYDGEILVPFAIESSLSGVMKRFEPTDKLWYRRRFVLDETWKGKRILLHFGAVDYACQVWVNGTSVGTHRGGNNPFCFDITETLKRRGEQIVEVAVVDPTDTESISRGKQQLNQKGIWYTPVSGIWQTVWLEAVPECHIMRLQPEADIERRSVRLTFDVANARGGEEVLVELLEQDTVVKRVRGDADENLELTVPDAELWSPSSPRLYHIRVTLLRSGHPIDRVRSYFALRKVSIARDACGYNRICLNDEPVFQLGTLDQGWWPDGLLTPPSEEAMLYDMTVLKRLGFNTVRKHIKVEPELYYYYADSLGLMLWQDMVSGFATSRKNREHVKADAAEDWTAPAEHSAQWQGELFEMIDRLRFYSCITTWVVFNEGWGQHNTREIVGKVMSYDRSRIIDGVTGWADRGVGHLYDVHNYPVSTMILPENNGDRISALGEFGGYGWAIEAHLWDSSNRNWGYQNIEDATSLVDRYGKLMYDLETLVAQGLGAAIYTQTTDVEGEVNGLMTYDRRITKLPESLLHCMHDRLYKILPARADVLIGDAQGGREHRATVHLGEEPEREYGLPLTVEKENTVLSETTFQVDRPYTHLSLWLKTGGDVRIWLNDREVFASSVKQTRQYNQFNLSDYSTLLRPGRNRFRIEVRTHSKVSFDYGLRAY